jgi:hypothetical protein
MVNPDLLRKGFAWFVLVMAALILAQEAGPVVGAAAAATCVLVIVMALGCKRFEVCPWRRLMAAPA